MLGKIYTPPAFTVKGMRHENDTCQEKRVLINQLTGRVINVRNNAIDFRVIHKERSLYQSVLSNPKLTIIADTAIHNNRNERFCSLGMAVSAVYNLGENGKAKEESVKICENAPLKQSIDFLSNPALSTRGEQYIHQFIDANHPLDSTNYATGLRVGSDMRQTLLDPIMITHFTRLWDVRLNPKT